MADPSGSTSANRAAARIAEMQTVHHPRGAGGVIIQRMTNRSSRMRSPVPFSLCCLLALPLACAKQSTDTSAPAAGGSAVSGASTADELRDDDANTAGIVIDPKIAELCAIPTAHFEFDSSALSRDATQALDALSSCFIDGPAKGKAMRMVGHADPRGTEEYNLALGQRRAGSVAGYIIGRGLEDSMIETSSRGELDAKGTDEASWALDRKVGIFLAD